MYNSEKFASLVGAIALKIRDVLERLLTGRRWFASWKVVKGSLQFKIL